MDAVGVETHKSLLGEKFTSWGRFFFFFRVLPAVTAAQWALLLLTWERERHAGAADYQRVCVCVCVCVLECREPGWGFYAGAGSVGRRRRKQKNWTCSCLFSLLFASLRPTWLTHTEWQRRAGRWVFAWLGDGRRVRGYEPEKLTGNSYNSKKTSPSADHRSVSQVSVWTEMWSSGF